MIFWPPFRISWICCGQSRDLAADEAALAAHLADDRDVGRSEKIVVEALAGEIGQGVAEHDDIGRRIDLRLFRPRDRRRAVRPRTIRARPRRLCGTTAGAVLRDAEQAAQAEAWLRLRAGCTSMPG